MLGQRLDFGPGLKYAYANFGYCLLGRIIEKLTGKSYETYIKTELLEPLGISRMAVGKSLSANRLPGEVRYYDYPGASLAKAVFPDTVEPVPWPYGGFYLEALDAHGGWVASVIDLMRFLTAFDGRSDRPDLLTDATIKLMTSRPEIPQWQNSSYYYGMGWLVRPVADDANWWHTGSLPGTSSIIVRAYNGMLWVALFNSRPRDQDLFFKELDESLWKAVNGITEWPEEDLFFLKASGNGGMPDR